MFGELVPQGGGDLIPLNFKKLLVGRRNCDINLPFPNVSSRHCELEFQDGYWLIRDLGSSNGTKVNGVRVHCKWVFPGDELSIARHRYKIDYEVAKGATLPPPLDDVEENILGTSLLEKAGLTRRRPPESRRSRRPAPKPAPPRPPTVQSTDEDQALDWLQDDDEE